MAEPDKYRTLIGRTLASHMYELLQILAEENAYTLIVHNGKPELSFHVNAVRRALDHVEQAWHDIHSASAPKASVTQIRKFVPDHIEAQPLTPDKFPEMKKRIQSGEVTPLQALITKRCNPEFARWMELKP